MANQTSMRANQIGSGGIAQTSPAQGQGATLFPSTSELLSAAEYFQEQSLHNCTQLSIGALSPAQPTNYQINNIGMGESLELMVTGSISLANTAVGAQVVSLSPYAPFNLIQSILVQMNGQTVIDSLSPIELLAVMAKRSKKLLRGGSAGTPFTQNLITVDPAIAWFKAGANVTFTTGNTLTGIASASIAGSSTGVITFGMYLELPFVYNKKIPFGLLPLQNNSIYANVQLQANNFLGATAYNPFYVSGGVPSTLTNSANAITVKPTYNFWSIPSDPQALQLAQYFASNVYMLLSQGNNVISKSGSQSLQYNLPNNYILSGLLATIYDVNNMPVDTYTNIDNPYINYNGTAIVDKRDMLTRTAKDVIYYQGAAGCSIGQYWHDFTNCNNEPNMMNTSQMLNMYEASNPMMVADVGSGVSLNAYFSVLREQIVPSQVKTLT